MTKLLSECYDENAIYNVWYFYQNSKPHYGVELLKKNYLFGVYEVFKIS